MRWDLPFADVRLIEDGTTVIATAFPQRQIRIDQFRFETRPMPPPRPTWDLTSDDRLTLAVIADHLLDRGHHLTHIDERHVVWADTTSLRCEVDHILRMDGRVCVRCGVSRDDVRLEYRAYDPWEVVRVADGRLLFTRSLCSPRYQDGVIDERLETLRAMLSSQPSEIPRDSSWLTIHRQNNPPPLMVERFLVGNVNHPAGPMPAQLMGPFVGAEGVVVVHAGTRVELVLSTLAGTAPCQVRATAICIEGG